MFSRDAKFILNSLKCPLCKGQIDLLSHETIGRSSKYNFGCAINNRHYVLFFNHWGDPIEITLEKVTLFNNLKCYEIIEHIKPSTIIKISKTDLEDRILDNVEPKYIIYPYNIFDFQNTDKDKIINRLTMMLLYQ